MAPSKPHLEHFIYLRNRANSSKISGICVTRLNVVDGREKVSVRFDGSTIRGKSIPYVRQIGLKARYNGP